MIDTNSISAAAQAVNSVQTQINWQALVAGALWLRADLVSCSEWIIGHGGLGYLLKKLWWNPPSK